MGGSVLFSLLLALTIVPKASTQSTTMSSTAAGSTASTPMMSSTAAGSTASTTIMSLTTAGSTSTTAMMSSTTAGSTASTPMMGSTEAGSTASTTMESSTAAGSTASTAMMGSTAAGSTASTTMMGSTAAGSTASTTMESSTAAGSTASAAMMSSTAAGSTASAAMMSSTAAGSTATTAMMSSTAAGSTASATMVSSTTAATPSTTAARAPATTTTRSTAASTNATGPTDPPVLVFNGTVERLPSPISNAGCGNSLLCAGAPESCDPSKPGSCFFVGIKRTAGQNFEFSLSGESEGYIGCTLSTDSSLGGGDITFICANKDGTVEFIGASLNNSALSRKDVNANSVKGHINGNTIQCTFKATVPDATARGSATSFALAVVSGTFSPGTGDLGPPEAKVQTKVLNIANIISNFLNSGRPTNQGLSAALLIIIVTMGLAFI
ncbi:uncharacterized protein LOC115529432 isoform X2 [Gadus morhua]|nr:uncharacterized protein LOC115529432 isoform X2 [Gadus morhua]